MFRLPTMPLNFELPMETRTRHTGKEMITVQERTDGPDKLGASPGATNIAMRGLSAG